MDKKQLLYFLSWLSCFLAITFYLYSSPGVLTELSRTPWQIVFLLCCLIAITWLNTYIQSYISLAAISSAPPFFEYLSIFSISILANYSPVKVGLAIRAAYLAKFQGVKVSAFIALLSYRSLMLILISAFISGLAFLFKGIHLIPVIMLCSVFVVSYMALRLDLAMNFLLKLKLEKKSKHLFHFLSALTDVSIHKRTFLGISFLVMIEIFLLSGRMYICLDYVGLNISTVQLILITSTTAILGIISVTPGGIGIKEVVIAALGIALELPFSDVVQAMLLDSACLLITVGTVGIYGMLTQKVLSKQSN